MTKWTDKAEDTLQKRRKKVLDFIDTHFESMNKFAKAVGLNQSSVSQNLQPGNVTHRRLLPIEYEIRRLKAEKEGQIEDVPEYRLDTGERELVVTQQAGTHYVHAGYDVEWEKVVKVRLAEHTYALIELLRPKGLTMSEVEDVEDFRKQYVPYLALIGSEWTEVTLGYDEEGRIDVAGEMDPAGHVEANMRLAAGRFFGRVVQMTRPGQPTTR